MQSNETVPASRPFPIVGIGASAGGLGALLGSSIGQLRSRTGDASPQYKKITIARRFDRRMGLHQLARSTSRYTLLTYLEPASDRSSLNLFAMARGSLKQAKGETFHRAQRVDVVVHALKRELLQAREQVQTSREELKSMKDELRTVNHGLQARLPPQGAEGGLP